MMKQKIVLAFSGGLDTTYCAIYLNKIKNYEVHAISVNTGGFNEEEVAGLKKHAENLGVASYKCVDVTQKYYDSCIKYLIFGNVLKNATYPLSVSAERMIQAITVADYAKQIGATAVAHGSTGAGNDQVRFDMVFQTMIPNVEIVTPIRDLKLSREEEINFLKEHNVSMNFEKAAYSINKGLWGTSVGGKETLNSKDYLPETAWPTQVTATEEKQISLQFTKGELVGIDDTLFANKVETIQTLQALAQPYGIGRDIHVGDTIIGIKGRVGFEAAAPIIIIKAHHLLEKHTLTKQQLYWKQTLGETYGTMLHEGQFLEPVMRNFETFLADTQANVTGTVDIHLAPYRYQMIGIESKYDLMSSIFGTYGEMNNSWSGDDVRGFSKIVSNQTMIHRKVTEYGNK